MDMGNSMTNGDLVAAIQSFGNINNERNSMELPSDPDAQATVTDFLDFTEYLPADMVRSLTLIGNLDKTYTSVSAQVRDLTKTYGELPSIPLGSRGDPMNLRADIAQGLNEVTNARTLAYAEAIRMAENVDRHYNRAKNILTKLEAMAAAYPPSREGSPAGSPQATRTPKITIRLGESRARSAEHGGTRIHVHRHRAPRITVPGEVLAPYETGYTTSETETEESESDDEEPLTPQATSMRAASGGPGRMRPPKTLKTPKMKVPKPPRGPRPPGVMGTNVHSAVAGISTSNALAKLTPPPPDAVIGSKYLPWLQLTQWELAKLRKKMKKNAVWNPSAAMVHRELKERGRGKEARAAALKRAEASGEPFEDARDSAGENTVGSLNLEDPEIQTTNRGMKLNEQKKQKKENERLLAQQAAEEAEDATRKMAEQLKGISSVFPPASKAADQSGQKTPETPVKTPTKVPPRKRKRESVADMDLLKIEGESTGSKVPLQPQKKSKMETPVPPPPSSANARLTTAQSAARSRAVIETSPTADQSSTTSATTTVTTTTSVPLRASPPRKSSTPILPPVKEPKKEIKQELKKLAAAVTNISTSTTPASTRRRTPGATTPVPEIIPTRRPPSRGKAASAEPAAVVGRDRPRRASTVHNTPAPDTRPPSRQSNRRAKRPAPGLVTAGPEGSSAISVGKRAAAPRKKAGPKKQPKEEEKDVVEVMDEIDDEGNIIDPNEPRYCLCDRVSFGVMICCENLDCEKEWFHLGCVGLSGIPPRTTKWYCPACRVKLGIGEKGEVTARGKKK